jgi:hypothetical protein
MLDGERGETTARVVIIVCVAKEGRKENFGDRSLHLDKFHADILLDPLHKLPLLLLLE